MLMLHKSFVPHWYANSAEAQWIPTNGRDELTWFQEDYGRLKKEQYNEDTEFNEKPQDDK